MALDLRRVTTMSRYDARESTIDMKGRIAAFIESADDSFHLPSGTAATGAGYEAAEITADFTGMMLDTRSRY